MALNWLNRFKGIKKNVIIFENKKPQKSDKVSRLFLKQIMAKIKHLLFLIIIGMPCFP